MMADETSRLGDLLFDTPVVKFSVGEERKLVYIHEELLTTKMEFFRKMFRSKFVEARKEGINLERMPTQVMRLLCQWLYNDRISPIQAQDKMARSLSAQPDEPDWLAVESMYYLGISFAEEWLCYPFARQLFNRIRGHHIKPKKPIDHQLLFDTLPRLQETSPFRMWLIDLTWAHMQSDQGLFIEFCEDLARLHQEARTACSKVCKQLVKLNSKTERVCSQINAHLTTLKAESDEVKYPTGVAGLASDFDLSEACSELTDLHHATNTACIEVDNQLAILRTPEAQVLQEFVEATFRVNRSKKSIEDVLLRELYVTAAPTPSKAS